MQSNNINPITTVQRMKLDDLAWDRSDDVAKAWKDALFDEKVLREIGRFIIKHRGGPAEELFNPQKGSFNLMFRMKFMDGGSVIIRFPIPGVSVFPESQTGGICYEIYRATHKHTCTSCSTLRYDRPKSGGTWPFHRHGIY